MSKAMYVVTLVSRNKDNKDVPGFKQRNESFFTDEPVDSKILKDKFNYFVNCGVDGEASRLYYSVNARDTEKSNKALCKFLVDNPSYDLRKVKYKHISIASLPQNAATKHWLFDFDIDDKEKVEEFVQDIVSIDNDIEVTYSKTPHGFAVITSRGFDTRTLFKKWAQDVELKKDDMLCAYWKTK